MTSDESGERSLCAAAAASALAGSCLLVLAACAASSGGAGSPAAFPDTVAGTVRQVGSNPFVRTLVEGTDTVTVTGDLESEISRLSGARVRVVGSLATGDFPGPTLDAGEYRILAVDGERPEVGVLRADGDGLYLDREGEDPLRLRAVTASLERNLGAKIWVLAGEDGTVRRYGILRPPEK